MTKPRIEVTRKTRTIEAPFALGCKVEVGPCEGDDVSPAVVKSLEITEHGLFVTVQRWNQGSMVEERLHPRYVRPTSKDRTVLNFPICDCGGDS